MSEIPSAPAPLGLNPLRPRVLHTAYHVRDLERSVAFYAGTLGMQELMRFQLPSGEWECVLAFVGKDGKPQGSGVILMWQPEREREIQPGDGYSRLVLRVSELDAAVRHLEHRGVPLSVPVATNESLDLRYAMCEDPDGYTIELMQLGLP